MTAATERRIGIMMSYVNIILQAGIGFLYVPLLLHYIGQAEYGLYQLIGSIIAYFGVMDFGLSTVVVRFYARYRALGDRRSMENILAIAQVLFAVVTVLALVVGAVCYGYLDAIFGASLSASELAEARDIFALLLVNIAVTLLTMVYNAVINAEERFLVLKGLSTVQLVMQPILVLLILQQEPTAFAVALAQTVLTCVLSAYRLFYCYQRLGMRLRYHYLDHALLADFRRLALSVFLASLVNQIFYKTNQVILGVVAGTSAVAVYSVASMVYMNYASLSTAISGVYLPHVSALVAQRAPASELSALFTRIGRWQYYLLALVLTGFILFGQEFIRLWAGPGFADAYWMSLLIMVPFTIDLVENVGLSILQAQNRFYMYSLIYACMGAAQLGLSIVLGLQYGAIGCATATGIVIFLGKGLTVTWYYAHAIGIDIAGFWRGIARISVAVAIALAAGLAIDYAIDYAIGTVGVALLVVKIAIYTAIYGSLVYRLAMNEDERTRVRSVLRRR